MTVTGENKTCGLAPVPLTKTLSVPDGPLCANTIDPTKISGEGGVKETTNGTVVAGAMVIELGLTENSAPVGVTELISRGDAPVFVTRTVSDFVESTWTTPNAMKGGIAVNPAVAPIPWTRYAEGEPEPS
jgi:hypothetical protein